MQLPFPTFYIIVVAIVLVLIGATFNNFQAVQIHGLVSAVLFSVSACDFVFLMLAEKRFAAALRKHSNNIIISIIMMVLQTVAVVGCMAVAADHFGFTLSDVAASRLKRKMEKKRFSKRKEYATMGSEQQDQR
mmetsp:Transcript_37186/g.58116  ORF Transcript_37186/g.58116 Transcript_37186/m.58116 type:complete len:133 (-) Transcript_37186:68-466(-)